MAKICLMVTNNALFTACNELMNDLYTLSCSIYHKKLVFHKGESSISDQTNSI